MYGPTPYTCVGMFYTFRFSDFPGSIATFTCASEDVTCITVLQSKLLVTLHIVERSVTGSVLALSVRAIAVIHFDWSQAQ